MNTAVDSIIPLRINESIVVKQMILGDAAYLDQLHSVGMVISDALRNGRKVLFFGNGGSAADSQHLAAEFTGRYLRDRKPLAALALGVNISGITAIGNDYSFDMVFSRQLEALGQQGDVAVGITTSGDSENVIEAIRTARTKGMTTIALTGQSGGRIREYADYCLCVPSQDTPRIQEAHIMTGHILCEIVENDLLK